MYVFDAIKSNFLKSGDRVPILLELRGKSPVNLLPAELLGTWAQRYRIHAAAMMKLMIAGRLIIIFEGFDEMANVSDLEDRLGHFRSLWKFALPKSKLIFTGRRNLFFADQELEIAFKGAEGEDSQARCLIIQLKPFNIEKIRLSLRWTDRITTDEIVRAANSSEQILEIVARPSLLYIVATLWPELRHLFAVGRMTSAEVIDKFIFHSYQRQAEKAKESPPFMRLSTTERRYFHEGLAVYMASQGKTNQITNADLDAAMERLYRAYPDDTHVTEQVKFESDQAPLKKRLSDPEVALSVVGTDLRTHGILVNDPSRPDTFKFAHKSFYELLFGKVIAFSLIGIDKVFYNALRHAMDNHMGDVEQSREILNFFSEILVGKLKETCGKEQIITDVFDILAGTWRLQTGLRQIIRTFLVITARIANAPLAMLSVVTAVIGLLLSSVILIGTLRNSFAAAILGVHLVEERPYVAIVVAVANVIGGSLIWYLMLMQSRTRRLTRRWAAVLLYANFEVPDLERLIGGRLARRLEIEVASRWPRQIRPSDSREQSLHSSPGSRC